MNQSDDTHNDDPINWPHVLFVAIITLAVFWAAFAIFPFPDFTPHGMVQKILTGDLPNCDTTIGSDTGYYCQINNVSQYCKVDKPTPDMPLVLPPKCTAVMLV